MSQATIPLNAAAIRRDFPIFQSGDRPLVYLDSAATSQKPASVLAALDHYYQAQNANVHRGVYRLAEEATAAYEGARARVADFIGADSDETVFVRNATEAINLVAYAWGRKNIQRGDVILLSRLEHHSNLVPWQLLAQERGAELAFVELAADGSLDMVSFHEHLSTGRVRLVAIAYVSNVLGTIAPVAELVSLAHDAGAVVLLDGAQAVPHLPVDVRDLDVDFLAFTGHKMLGPMGIGVLYGKRDILEATPPFMAGGEMIRTVRDRSASWNDLPWKFEAGTPSVGDAVALGEAVSYLRAIGMEAIHEHDRILAAYAYDSLSQIPGIQIFGPRERGALVAFTVDGIHPHDLASLLDEQGIAVRAGHHCAQPLHDQLGVPATTRASFYLYNTPGDVDALQAGILQAQKMFGP
ncbi:MAG: cysteine desulfurase [Chloroflexota bacterium]